MFSRLFGSKSKSARPTVCPEPCHIYVRLKLEELEARVVLSPPIGLSNSMPVVNQAVTLTVDSSLISYGEIIITGSQGTLMLPIDSQGQAVWTPSRYGQYSLSVGNESEDVWVTARAMIFDWWNGGTDPQNATIVMAGANSYWKWRGAKSVDWVGGEAYSRGVDGHYFTQPQEWLNNWSYAQATDGIAVDEIYAAAGFPTDPIVQAVHMVPAQWGPNYTLSVYVDGFGGGFSADANILKSVNAVTLVEDYGVGQHASKWAGVRQYGLQNQGVLTISPFFSGGGPTTDAQVRDTIRQIRLAAPESPGLGVFDAYGTGLDPSVDQAITDYFLKPVIYLSVNAADQLVAQNIGNDDAQGFSLTFLDRFGNPLQTVNLSTIQPNAQQTLNIPANAVTAQLVNPPGTVNLYPNGLYTIPPPPGQYDWTDANGDQLWSTFSDWNPHGPPPGNIDSGNYAYFDGNVSAPIPVIAQGSETSINSVRFATAGWTIVGSPTAQDFFTYDITSAGAGTNTVDIGYRTTSGVPAYFYVESNNTLVMNGMVYGYGGEIKTGAGTLVLTNNNTYPGPTSINAGTLEVDGFQPNSAITVASGATLDGTGQTGAVTVDGTLSPGGPATGILHTGNINFAPGSTYQVRLDGTTPGSGYDATVANGSINLGDANLTVSLGFNSSVGDQFTILSSTDPITGTFHGLSNGQIFAIGNAHFQIIYTANSVVLTHVNDYPGRYTWTDANGEQLWSTFSNWDPHGPPPGNIDSGNYAYFDGNVSAPIPVIAQDGETSIRGVAFATAGWSIVGSPTAQDFFAYWISSEGAGTNTVNIGYRTTSGVPAYFSVGPNDDLVMNGMVYGYGGLVKAGAGILVLTDANTYPGPTSINAGTLEVDGSQPSSAITVSSGATLDGTGQTGAVTVDGTLSPGGTATGILHTGSINFVSGSSYQVRLNGAAQGSGYDATVANGSVNLGDTNLTASLGFNSSVGDQFTILSSTGPITGTFHGLSNGQIFAIGNAHFQITYTANSVVLTHVNDYPGRYTWTDANGEQLWSTFSNWDPHGPPPGNIDSGNYAYFDGDISAPIPVIALPGETSINSVVLVTGGWSIVGSPTAQDFFTYSIDSEGAGTNTVDIGYRTTSGVPAYFYVGASNTLVMNGMVYGYGGEVKVGGGTLILTNNNTYPGPTNVNAGTLEVDGSQPNSAVTVASGATLDGTGQTGALTVNGILSPGGNATGILHTESINFAPGSTYQVRLDGTTPGSGYDATVANGSINLGDANLTVSLGFNSLVGDQFTILSSMGPITGTFQGLQNGQVFAIGNARFRIAYTGNSVILTHVADAATQFLVSAPASSQAGVPFDVTVAAVDAGGNVDPLYTGTIHFTSTDAAAHMPTDYTFTAADQGIVTFAGGVTLFTAGDQTVTITDTANSSIAGSAAIMVTPAAADHLVFLQQPTDTAAGQTIAPVMVAVVDQYGNVVTSENSDTITLSIGNNPGGGTLSGTLTVTVVNGIAVFSDLSIDLAGFGYTLHATVGGGLPDIDSNPFNII
jgi:autotransporter-associated beta strand protein